MPASDPVLMLLLEIWRRLDEAGKRAVLEAASERDVLPGDERKTRRQSIES